ncbi:hypothetical protein DFH06DRAFT_1133644 [Mycena polygramma]|nr:hypothetical protein DFH06DRAFT_1133644 [Mycena polygramma]
MNVEGPREGRYTMLLLIPTPGSRQVVLNRKRNRAQKKNKIAELRESSTLDRTRSSGLTSAYAFTLSIAAPPEDGEGKSVADEETEQYLDSNKDFRVECISTCLSGTDSENRGEKDRVLARIEQYLESNEVLGVTHQMLKAEKQRSPVELFERSRAPKLEREGEKKTAGYQGEQYLDSNKIFGVNLARLRRYTILIYVPTPGSRQVLLDLKKSWGRAYFNLGEWHKRRKWKKKTAGYQGEQYLDSNKGRGVTLRMVQIREFRCATLHHTALYTSLFTLCGDPEKSRRRGRKKCA